ncbi:phytoene synthase [Oxalobacteraceae bacterium GrIS 2.11]
MTGADVISTAEDTLAAKGRSFHWARRLLGKKHALRATRLYRFCRHIDDVVDEAESIDLSRKNLFEVRQSVLSGRSDHEILIDGLSLIRECRISTAVVLDLIAGVASDIEPVRMNDEDALLRYCYQVAGTVGLMMCKVLDSDRRQAHVYAIDLGIAMQLTNICRDIRQDALLNRRYLPSNFIGNMEPDALIEPSGYQVEAVKKAVARLLDCAEKYYESGESGLSYLPLRPRLSILVAARIYREIGKELEKQNYEYWHQRIVVRTTRKVIVTLRALLWAFSSPQFWRHPLAHDARLHSALRLDEDKITSTVQAHEN